jgi:hypothetical protein
MFNVGMFSRFAYSEFLFYFLQWKPAMYSEGVFKKAVGRGFAD